MVGMAGMAGMGGVHCCMQGSKSMRNELRCASGPRPSAANHVLHSCLLFFLFFLERSNIRLIHSLTVFGSAFRTVAGNREAIFNWASYVSTYVDRHVPSLNSLTSDRPINP